MSDLRVFSIEGQKVKSLEAKTLTLEKSLQNLIEANLEEMLGIRFLASEYSTGAKHGGRIDTLGLDENDCPVIIEYKRAVSENVINQGLFYLDWLNDHHADFRWEVMEKLGKEVADNIDWSGTRLVCVAGDFRKYDLHAIQQIPRNIELLRFGLFGGDVLTLEMAGSNQQKNQPPISSITPTANKNSKQAYVQEPPSVLLGKANQILQDTYDAFKAEALGLDDEIILNERKLYFAFRRVKNFACVEVRPSAGTLLVYLNINPTSVEFEEGFSRDVSSIGHWGTGNVEAVLREPADVQRVLPLLTRSYENS